MSYRKHRWEQMGAQPSVCLSSNQRHFPAYERCADCCVTRTRSTENKWCGNPRDKAFEPFPYPQHDVGDIDLGGR